MSTETKWDKPQVVDAITAVLQANVTGALLPPRADIPEDFRRETGHARQWTELVNRWFGCGLDGNEFTPKDGIDAKAAMRHLRACMSSFEPKHEDKIAGVAWLMSKWFNLAARKNVS